MCKGVRRAACHRVHKCTSFSVGMEVSEIMVQICTMYKAFRALMDASGADLHYAAELHAHLGFRTDIAPDPAPVRRPFSTAFRSYPLRSTNENHPAGCSAWPLSIISPSLTRGPVAALLDPIPLAQQEGGAVLVYHIPLAQQQRCVCSPFCPRHPFVDRRLSDGVVLIEGDMVEKRAARGG